MFRAAEFSKFKSVPRPAFSPSTGFRLTLAVLLALAHAVLAVTATTEKSMTSDEIAHLTAGHTYNTLGDFRLQPEKRPLYFLDCVRRVREVVPGLRVVLAGVGCLEGAVREAIARDGLGDMVLYLGQVDDVPRLLAASDVLLLMSDWEGTPNIVLEAQHFGCVPVATDAGGSREALCAGESGILVGANDPEEACRAVVGLLADPARRAKMRARGQDFVARAFAPAALVEGNARLYAMALPVPLVPVL